MFVELGSISTNIVSIHLLKGLAFDYQLVYNLHHSRLGKSRYIALNREW